MLHYNDENCIVSVEKFEDTKGVIRSRNSEKDRQYNGQWKKDKRLHAKLK